MSSLFRSLNNFSNKRESAIKESLLSTLSENAREIQYEAKHSSGQGCLELCETTNSLCTTLEAIFLHGLKDSFLWQTINVISGDVDHRPEPSFWSPVMVFMHKQVIEQIQSFTQITSEIGQCRCWVRLSLNESLFSSYLNNIRKNSSALNPYYKKCAFLKDVDALECAAKIVEGIEADIQINLPVNSSLLNQWPNYALQLSGIWTPALKSCPIASGVDVAHSLPTETESVAIPTPKPLQTNELFSESIRNSPFSRTSNFATEDFTHHENVDVFLQKVDEMDIIKEEDPDSFDFTKLESNTTKGDKGNKQKKDSIENDDDNDDDGDDGNGGDGDGDGESLTLCGPGHGNSLSNLMHTSWSSDLAIEGRGNSKINPNNRSVTPSDDGHPSSSHHHHHHHHHRQNQNQNQNHHRYLQRSVSMTSSVSSLRSPTSADRNSYNTLLRKHEKNREFDFAEIWEKFASLQSVLAVVGSSSHDDELIERGSSGSQSNSDFEVVTHSSLDKFDMEELHEMVEQVCVLAREPGLDAQGFLCKSCQHPLGIGYSNVQVCAFSGNYYCDSCMDGEQMIIPAKIIYNWDFRKYPVSKRSAAFLAEFRCQPFIDLQLLNPDIYNASEQMAELQSLRIRLNFIRAYLYTCCASSIEELQREFFGKEYLYEHIHQYSISDLMMIQRGTLMQKLQKAVKIGETHITKCALCSVKGFICEICNSSKVLYPFHIDTTFRCKPCGAVFHAQCLNEQQPCPKCERKRKREDLPLFEAVQNLL